MPKIVSLVGAIWMALMPACFAEETPDFPTSEALFQEFKQVFGTEIQDHFLNKEKAENNECRKTLEEKIKAYKTHQAAGAFVKMERVMADNGLLDLLNQCGPCSVVTKNGDGPYRSHGWCKFDQPTAESKKRVVADAQTFLTALPNYPKKKQGTFNYVLKFEPKKGETAPVPFLSGQNVIISVDAAVIAFSYLAKLEYPTIANPTSFMLTFNSQDAGPNGLPKRVIDNSVTPARTLTSYALKSAKGRWFTDGTFLNYYTIGDFGEWSIFASKDVANRVLMDTVWNVFEKLKQGQQGDQP